MGNYYNAVEIEFYKNGVKQVSKCRYIYICEYSKMNNLIVNTYSRKLLINKQL